MSTEPNGETAAVLYDLAREVVDDQAKAAAALDTKAFQTFTIGTVVLGIVAVSSEVDVASAILLVGAVLAYVVATYYALMGLAPRKYRATRQLGELLERYASGPPTAVHLAVVRDLADERLRLWRLLLRWRWRWGGACGVSWSEFACGSLMGRA